MPTSEDISWFKQQFGSQMATAATGTPFDADMIIAIACQETGYIWSVLRRKNLPTSKVVALCVGDTIDYKGPHKGRQAFPKNKADLVSADRGQAMFDIARQALEDMSAYIPGYGDAVSNPNKFCHGFGVFQRDLQFFKDDPAYFLERKYESFSDTLQECLEELHGGLKTLGWTAKTSLTDAEFACVAIAYNTGGYKSEKGLRQGYFDGTKYYGEYIASYIALSRSTAAATLLHPGSYVVAAREGLKLRGGPGTTFESSRTLPLGTGLNVVAIDGSDPAWVKVDLEGDGLLDGYVFGAFLSASPVAGTASESVAEP